MVGSLNIDEVNKIGKLAYPPVPIIKSGLKLTHINKL